MPKKRKRAQSPPLWIGDKILYIISAVLIFALFSALAMLPSYLRQKAVEADPSMLAYNGSGAALLVIPFFLYAFLSLILFTAISWSDKVPLLGNPKVSYGQHPWKKDVYPLLRKKPASFYEHPSHRNTRHIILILWAAVLIFTIFLGCFSIYGRYCLRDDLHIVFYNWRNHQTREEYTPADLESISLENDVRYGKGGKRFYLYFTVTMHDGQKFSFDYGDFPDTSNFAKTAAAICNRCTEVTIRDRGALPGCIDDWEIGEAEAKRLYQLFEQSPG